MKREGIAYRIYPSLLDKFQVLLNAEKDLEAPWNIDRETGEYRKTLAQIEDEARQSLLNGINRVPFHSLAADNGTVFNELVDCLHRGRKPFRDDIEFKTFKEQGLIAARFRQEGLPDELFYYDLASARNIAEFFRGSCCQLLVSGILPTVYGNVELYGYIDELKRDVVYDLKTTGSYYTFGKFEDHWQRWVYPYCLIQSGAMKDILAFEYSVLKWTKRKSPAVTEADALWDWIDVQPVFFDPATKRPVDIGRMVAAGRRKEDFIEQMPQFTTVDVYGFDYLPEFYAYNHDECVERLTYMVESFIEWIEGNREYIIDKKIFNQLED